MASLPAGAESDFSDFEDNFESIKDKTNGSTVLQKEKVLDNIFSSTNKTPIPWDKLSVGNFQGNKNYLEEIDPIKQKGVVNLFEENLKRLMAFGDLDGLKYLIEDGLELDFVFSSKFTLLSFSTFNHKLDLVEYLLDEGAKNIEGTISPIIALCSRKCSNNNEIVKSIEILEKLIKFNIDLNSISNDGENGVHFAVKSGNNHLLAGLVQCGVNLHAHDKNNLTPLHSAVCTGNINAVKIITSFFTQSEEDMIELGFASSMTHNYSIRSYLQSVIEDPSSIKPLELSEELINYTPDIPLNDNNRLELLLQAIGLRQLFPLFLKCTIRFSDLFKMDAVFLKNRLKLKDEEINKLKQIINEMMMNSFDKNSYFINNKLSLNLIDICISMNNLSDHLEFIESSISTLSDQMRIIHVNENQRIIATPRILATIDLNFCPSAIFTSLISITPLLDWPKHLLDFLDVDLHAILKKEEELQSFLHSVPRLIIKEEDALIESHIKLFVHRSSHHHLIKNRLLSILDIEHEAISEEDIEVFASHLHQWSKTKLSLKDFRFIKFEHSRLETDSLCVANTHHFSSSWKFPFDPIHTRRQTFHSHTELVTEVEMMYIRRKLRSCIHAELDISVIEIPFQHPHLSALIIHPIKKEIALSSILKKISHMLIDDCMALLEDTDVALLMPKLKFHSHVNITSQLEESEIIKISHQRSEKLRLTEFTQAVSMSLNESGINTKFSSRVAVTSKDDQTPPPFSTHKINRPFIMIIYHSHHRCPLLVSAIHHPIRR
ncbi:hypothetical protein HZS_4114 [Henneguya salminicola]|nr:hypothetical protein HZS_4114 [Henneguya salminicola]